MAQPPGFLLAHKVNVGQLGDIHNLVQHGLFFRAAAGQLGLQFRGSVEVIFNQPFAAVGDNQNIGNSRTHRLLHNILDGGFVHNGQHLFGHGFGGGKDARTQASCRNDRFAYFFHK